MDSRTVKLSARGLEHRFYKTVREILPPGSSILVAVSGGLDSVVLLNLFKKWQRALKIEIIVAHVHHGKSRTQQGIYRERAQRFAAKIATNFGLTFLTNDGAAKGLKSEAALRECRHAHLKEWREKWQPQPAWLATAHTADDLLETRLIRLIRGTGPDGLESMTVGEFPWLRPLLSENKATLRAYARAMKLKWCEDPSNRSVDPLRNWLRKTWLAPLKRRDSTGAARMANSLNLITERLKEVQPPLVAGSRGLSRPELMTLSLPDQRRALARYFRQAGLRNYTQGHVNEFLKRLDTSRRDLKFRLIGRQWSVNSDWIVVD